MSHELTHKIVNKIGVRDKSGNRATTNKLNIIRISESMHTPAKTRWFQSYSTVWRPSAIPTAPSNAALKPATASVISVLGTLLYGKSVYTHQIVANTPRTDRMIKNVYPGLVVCLFLLKLILLI